MSKIVKTPDCVIQKRPDGSRVCAVHGKPLQEQSMSGSANPPGPGHLSAWVCPDSGKTCLRSRDCDVMDNSLARHVINSVKKPIERSLGNASRLRGHYHRIAKH